MDSESIFPLEKLPTNLVSDIIRALPSVRDRISMSQTSPTCRSLIVGENCEPGILGKLKLNLTRHCGSSPRNMLLLSPPPFVVDQNTSFRFITWFRSVLPLLDRYFLAFESIQFSEIETISFQVAVIILTLLSSKDFKGSLSVHIRRLDFSVTSVHTTEFFRALTQIASNPHSSLSFNLESISSSVFWGDFLLKLEALAPKIAELKVHPATGFAWSRLAELKNLQYFFVDVPPGEIHDLISDALPSLSRLQKLEFEDVPVSVLTALSSLREFTYSSSRSTDNEEKLRFLRALPELPSLQRLEFEFMSVGDEDADTFIPTFSHTHNFPATLETLIIHSEFRLSLMEAFLRTFPESPGLKHLVYCVTTPYDLDPSGAPIVVDVSFPNLAYSFPQLESIHISTRNLQLPSYSARYVVKVTADLSLLKRFRRLSVSDKLAEELHAGENDQRDVESSDSEDDDFENPLLALQSVDVSSLKLPAHVAKEKAGIRREKPRLFALGSRPPRAIFSRAARAERAHKVVTEAQKKALQQALEAMDRLAPAGPSTAIGHVHGAH